MEKQKLKPGKWLYLIGVLLIVAGIVCTIAVAVSGVFSMLQNSQKVTVPGSCAVKLSQAGTYSLAYSETASGKPIVDASAYANLKFTITDPNNKTVTVLSPTSNQKVFTITTPGVYSIAAAYPGGSGPSAKMMLISTAGFNGTLMTVLFWVFLALGVGLIILTAVLRHNYKKRLNA